MSRLFQIHEQDLADLEALLPPVMNAAIFASANAQADEESKETSRGLRTTYRRVQTILTNVRWDYGPPEQVGIVSA